MRIRLTEKKVRSPSLAPGDYFDASLPGFFLYVGKQSRTYYVQRQIRKASTGRMKSVRRRVSRADLITLVDARTEAKAMLAKMQVGIDPAEEARAKRARSITLADALELHLSDGEYSPRTIKTYRRTCETHLGRFMPRELAEIGADRKEVRRLHQRITKKSGTYAANAAMRILRAIYNSGRRQHPELPESPTINVRFHKERSRSDKSIPPQDLAAWYAKVVAIQNPIRRDFQLFLLFTGLRRESAANVRWEHFDRAKRLLLIPEPKGGADRAFEIPISSLVVDLFERRLRENAVLYEGSEWVFPTRAGRGRSGRVVPIREPKEFGLPGPHALRHTYATVANAVGVPPLSLKWFLNHKTVSDVTEGYVSPYTESQRKFQERVSQFLLKHLRAPLSRGNRSEDRLLKLVAV